MAIFEYKFFGGLENTGGATGSGKAQHAEGWFGQLKSPIKFAKLSRRIKAQNLDTENYSEIIASHIMKAITPKEDQHLVPQVSFVTGFEDNQVGVVSKYLENVKGELLSDKDTPNFKDTQLVTRNADESIDQKSNNSPIHVITNEQKQYLLKGISRSIIFKDHDINPGNFLKIGTNEVARIDFGHAFNDLIKFRGAENAQNSVLDFINREKIDSSPFKDGTSKLWRSYENFIPSKDFADALAETANESSPKNIKAGIENAKAAFNELLNQPGVDKKQVLESLASVANNLDSPKIKVDLSTQEKTINEAFARIETSSINQASDMQKTAALMHAQVELDEILKKPDFKAQDLLDWRNKHHPAVGIDVENEITWIKASKNTPAVVGTVRDYIKASGKNLGLDQQKLDSILSNTTLLPKTSIISKVMNRFRSYSESDIEHRPSLYNLDNTNIQRSLSMSETKSPAMAATNNTTRKRSYSVNYTDRNTITSIPPEVQKLRAELEVKNPTPTTAIVPPPSPLVTTTKNVMSHGSK